MYGDMPSPGAALPSPMQQPMGPGGIGAQPDPSAMQQENPWASMRQPRGYDDQMNSWAGQVSSQQPAPPAISGGK